MANTYTTEVGVTVRPGLLDTVAVSLARLVVVGMVLRLRPVTLARRHAWYVHGESVNGTDEASHGGKAWEIAAAVHHVM